MFSLATFSCCLVVFQDFAYLRFSKLRGALSLVMNECKDMNSGYDNPVKCRNREGFFCKIVFIVKDITFFLEEVAICILLANQCLFVLKRPVESIWIY